MKSSLFGERHKPAIGIEITSDRLHAVHVRTDSGAQAVTRAITLKIAEDAGESLDRLHEFAGGHAITGFSAPMEWLTIQHCLAPALSPDDLSGLAENEIAQAIDYPLDEASIDYTLSDCISAKDGLMQRLIVFACQKRLVQHWVDRFKSIELETQIVEAPPLALINALEAVEPGAKHENIMVVNVDYQNCLAVVVKQGAPLFIRNIPTPKAVLESEQIQTAMPKSLAYEIQRTLNYCKGQMGALELQRVYLSGGLDKLGALDRAIGSELEFEIRRLDIPASGPVSSATPDRLAVAAGIAFRLAVQSP